MLPSNKKLSILCVLEVLKKYSDQNHLLTQKDIAKKVFDEYGLELERKSIGASVDSLIDFGCDIVKNKNGCFLAERELEDSEISFLVDAVFSSRSIDSANSQKLAAKLSQFLSVYDRKKFKYICKADQIIRTNFKQLFFTIDVLNEAIDKGKKVEFNYNRFYFDKEMDEKRKAKRYVINPYFMINNLGRYYLVCNLEGHDEIANYKIELISNIKILDSDVRPIKELKNCENGVDIAKYANENVYMFHNDTVTATIKIEDEYAAEYIMEWFGKNARFFKKDGTTYAEVTANEQALHYWCLQYGDSVELIAPENLREKIKNSVKNMAKKYK